MSDNEPTLRDLFLRTGPAGSATLDTQLVEIAHDETGFPAKSTTGQEIAGHLESALDTGVSTILATVWNKRKEIQKYGDVAKYPPDKVNYVGLLPHDVKWSIEPTVRVSVNHGPYKDIKFTLEGKFHIEGMELRIQGGRIMGIHSGQWWLEGKLTSGKFTLAERKSDKQRLPGEVSFGDGIEIPAPAATT